MQRNLHLASVLTAVLLSGVWARRALERRAVRAFGPRSRKRAKRLVAEILSAIGTPYAPSSQRLERLIRSCESLQGIGEQAAAHILALDVSLPPPRFLPIKALEDAGVPKIATQGDLARWLDIPLMQIDWLTDERRTLSRAEDDRLHHYTCHWVPKRRGAWRLIEAPKGRIKSFQRRILHEILDRLPVHDAAYGFVKGRSCTEGAAKHAGEEVILSVDLKNFFLNISAVRVHALFRCLGYPAPVARMLTSLCTTSTPQSVLARKVDDLGPDRVTRENYRVPHLPQGAPTSPALANLAAHGFDCRLAGLARRFGARYTRYADDLTFSGDATFRRQSDRFLRAISQIAKEEGFALNAGKTRIMPSNARQTVTGLVVNQHVNLARPAYDALKATLTNCARHGPASQNRGGHPDFRAHLNGRITWIESINLRRGEKLRRLFNTIGW
jgi:RNA-directed DNA polymerase